MTIQNKMNQSLKQKKLFSEKTNKNKFPTKTYSNPSFLVITIFNIIGCVFGFIVINFVYFDVLEVKFVMDIL